MRSEVITFDADPKRGGFGYRVHSLVRMLASFSDVHVVQTAPGAGPPIPRVTYEVLHLREGLPTKLRRLRTYYRTDFPRRSADHAPDLVFVESPEHLGLHQWGPGVPFVLDEHNVWWDYLRYEIVNAPFFRTWAGQRAPARRLLVPRLLRRAKEYEAAALLRAARTLVTSDRDRAAILGELPQLADRVFVLPNCVDATEYDAIPPAPAGSTAAVFVGGFNYVPNREAARVISGVLAPAVPEARFLLVGAHPPELPDAPRNVAVAGYVEDLRPVLGSAAVCIAPITQGSGTRLKILTYLAAGRAVVATRKACEGLAVTHGEHLLLHDDWIGFAGAVRELLRDPDRRRALGEAGRALVRERYDWRAHVSWMRRFAEDVVRSALSPRGGNP